MTEQREHPRLGNVLATDLPPAESLRCNPQSEAVPIQTKKCRFGAHCSRIDCYYVHPVDRVLPGDARPVCEITQLDSTSFVDFLPSFLSAPEADALFQELLVNVPWRTVVATTRFSTHTLPRLQCWMSDDGVQAQLYQKEPALPWSPAVRRVKQRIEQWIAGTLGKNVQFDYVLMNYYRDGRDKIGFHRDDEAEEEGKNVIASISLGAERTFLLKPALRGASRAQKAAAKQFEFRLAHGSMVVMRGDTQLGWLHSVPPQEGLEEPRINLTLRKS